jgi:hypothetical protein
MCLEYNYLFAANRFTYSKMLFNKSVDMLILLIMHLKYLI